MSFGWRLQEPASNFTIGFPVLEGLSKSGEGSLHAQLLDAEAAATLLESGCEARFVNLEHLLSKAV